MSIILTGHPWPVPRQAITFTLLVKVIDCLNPLKGNARLPVWPSGCFLLAIPGKGGSPVCRHSKKILPPSDGGEYNHREMKIEKIELTGFKSFCEKTTFTLHPGITCIVGPNGCGKSNIVDAFRWVLGEQSAKMLRGNRMDEVIFSGSQSRKPRGMAEVNLHISFPEEGNGGSGSNTVVVTRRLYRSGESEYLINRQPCRLRDIREIFLDTGLEMRSYSILEQGRIGEIINAKPEERRFLIEEVAGIMKYKVRRAEAENKLQSSRLNLQRIGDILSEVKRQMNSLNRQAKKAERYRESSDLLREAELRLSRHEYLEMSRKTSELRRELSGLKEREALLRRDITERENTVQQRRIRLIEDEKSIEAEVKALEEKEAGLRSLEQREALYRRDIEHMEAEIELLRSQIRELEEEQERREASLRELRENEARIKEKVEATKGVLRSREDELREDREVLRLREEELEEARKELFSLTDRLGLIRNDLNRLELQKEDLRRRMVRVTREMEEARRRAAEIGAEIKRNESEIEEKRREIQGRYAERERLNGELKAGLEKIKSLTAEKNSLREEVASVGARVASLNEMVRGEIDEDELKRKGIELLAALSAVVDVPEEYERAVEAALADKIMGHLVRSQRDLLEAARVVKERGLPRTAVLSVDDLEVPGGDDFDGVPGEGVLLSGVVGNENRFSPLVKKLLGSFLMVQDLETAHAMMERGTLPSGVSLVTRDGELLQQRGVLLCGSGSSILKVRREIRELEGLLQQKKSRLGEIDEEISRAEEAVEGIRGFLSEVEAGIVSLEKEISGMEITLRGLRDEESRFLRKADMLGLDRAGAEQELAGVEEAKRAKEEELSGAMAEREGMEDELDLIQNRVEELREVITQKIDALNQMKIELQGDTERLRSMEREMEGIRSAIGQMKRRALESGEAIERKKTETEKKREELREIGEKLEEVARTAQRLRQGISGKREVIRTEQEELLAEEASIGKVREELNRLSEDIHAREIGLTELEMKTARLVEGIIEKYGVDVSSEEIPLEGLDPEEEREKVRQLREKLEAMGPVNLAALDEHRELSERYEFLSRQHQDIVSSIEELEEAISRINRTTRKLLRDAFEGLNKKFREVFTTLFGGGSAELRLTDEKNILESGIEIVAQPPGKRLQNLNLLSGGEKALAAVSLLFAGFLLKPSPLCILDEADAPLDESNTVRFREMLRDLTRNIQFIVITHNRITMEGAEYLYGITMEEPGVSKVLSLEFA